MTADIGKFDWSALVRVSANRITAARRAVVLLSGGLDSTACALIARSVYPAGAVRALLIDYGQPHRRELVYAAKLADRLGLEHDRMQITEALAAMQPARMADAPHTTSGPHPATVPGRNLIMLTIAAARAAQVWPDKAAPIDLVIGSCADDHEGFADCRPVFHAQATVCLTAAFDRPISVQAPLARLRKRDYMTAAVSDADAVEHLRRSWSCYRGGADPCGECTPCVLRAGAFKAAAIEDAPEPVVYFGGDPHRDQKYAGG
jgi:7-cyano-7-deazaguanine synthase